MPVSFSQIHVGGTYSRKQLAALWGYDSYHAIARGVVTPAGDHRIILFVTSEKQPSAEQYDDHLEGGCLYWEGPNDHFAEDRMAGVRGGSGDEIHLFYRERHHSDFEYLGRLAVETHERRTDRPSRFVFRLLDAAVSEPTRR